MPALRAGHIVKVTAVSEPLRTGQYITKAIIEYDQELLDSSVEPFSFLAEKRHILRAYAASSPASTCTPANGRFIILELDPKDEEASLLFNEGEAGREPRNTAVPKEPSGSSFENYATRGECRVVIRQAKALETVSGQKLPANSEWVASSDTINHVIDSFRSFSFKDFNTAVYIPEDYEETKSYPLVLFLSDASVLGDDPMLPLLQGNGSVSFADPRFQKTHPCIILAPAIPEKYRYRSTEGLSAARRLAEPLMQLLEKTAADYHVDKDRIYLTGQSLGCFTSCALNILYPDYFAASLLIAGQWNAGEMAPLYRKNLWLITSDGDRIACPSMNAIADTLEKQGAQVGRYFWNAKDPEDILQKQAAQAAREPGNIKYSIWTDSSVVTEDYEVTPISNHFCTWPISYTLDAPREWLFTKSLNSCQEEY